MSSSAHHRKRIEEIVKIEFLLVDHFLLNIIRGKKNIEIIIDGTILKIHVFFFFFFGHFSNNPKKESILDTSTFLYF